MQKTYVIVLMSLFIAGLGWRCGQQNPEAYLEQDYPKLGLSKGGLKLVVFPSNKEDSYYRGSRFEWGGQIAQVYYKGHTFFREWKSDHDRTAPSHGVGTASEFDPHTPLLYDSTSLGDSFIKIGVGKLKKDTQGAYEPDHSYEIIDSGIWEMYRKGKWIEYHQNLYNQERWGYYFVKRSEALDSSAVRHKYIIENTGLHTWQTEHVAMNLLSIDYTPVGPDYAVTFPFEPEILGAGDPRVQVQGHTVVFLEPIDKESPVDIEIGGFDPEQKSHNQVTVTNSEAGAGVTISTDRPAIRFRLYADDRVISPRPVVFIRNRSARVTEWNTVYRFFEER